MLIDSDNELYTYSIRNPKGFFMRTVIDWGLMATLNLGKVQLSKLNSILDLGCGTGDTLKLISNIRESCEGLVGLDISKNRIEIAKRTNPAIKWLEGSMTCLPFGDKSFDLVTAFVSFMFLMNNDDLYQTMEEIKRVVKPGKYFILYENCIDEDKEHRCFKPEQLYALGQVHGFTPINVIGLFKHFEKHGRNFSTAYAADSVSLANLFQYEFGAEDHIGYNNLMILFKRNI